MKFWEKNEKKYKTLSPQFIFLYPTLNFRNNEIGAVIGINQLKRLNKNNKKRKNKFNLFLKNLDKKKYFVDFDIGGSCNYAFPIILKTKNIQKRNYFERKLNSQKIEFRRGNAGGGNQLRQPYISKFLNIKNFKHFRNVEHVHSFGYYIGNFPSLDKKKIAKLVKFLNSINL